MRKTRVATIVVLVLAALGYLLWTLSIPGEREPVYQGLPLSYWLEDFWPGSKPTPEKLEKDKFAVRQIGTNAIPILLQWISAKDGPVKQKMAYWISQHPWVPIRFESAVAKNMLAVNGFEILGKTQADSAVPALVEIVKSGRGEETFNHRNQVTFAMWALAAVDLEAATNAGIQFGTNGAITGWKPPHDASNK